MQADKFETLGRHNVAVFAALLRRNLGRILRQREVGYFNTRVAGLPNRPTGIGEAPAFEHFVANRVAEVVWHPVSIVITDA